MKTLIVFFLILLALIAITLIFIGISNKDSGIDRAENNLNTDNDKTTGDVVKDDSEDRGISGNAVGGSSRGGSSGSSESAGESSESENNPEITQNRELPSDLNTRPCGFYFVEYDVCAGVCPGGQCLIDGKSCYCRIV